MRSFLTFVFVLLLAAAALGGSVAYALYEPYRGFASQGVFVDIPHGASQRTMGRLLASQGVVRSRWVFEALCRWRGRRSLEAGEYLFDHPVTPFEVFDALANGRVYVRELVVPEGYSMFDIADLVEREGFTTREDFLAAAQNPSLIRDLDPAAPSLEGFLFPATYEFPRHPTGEQMVEAMVKRFRQEWTTISAGNGDPSIAPPALLEQTLTLASLVERETPRAEERSLVAGVFANRLRRHQPLECDPTTVYALELAGKYSGTLGSGDLHFESPYNTYRHAGLPPGPIANPGEASIRAAMDPAQTDYLYFVANTEGGHLFGKTLAEHNRNVAIYRRRLAEEHKAAHTIPTPQPASAPSIPRRSP